MRHKLAAVLGVASIAIGVFTRTFQDNDDGRTSFGEILSYLLIVIGVALLIAWLGWMYLSHGAKEEKSRMQFARIDMRAIMLSMVYQAMKEKQDELSPEEEAKVRALLVEKAGIKLDDKAFADLLSYAKAHQRDYRNKIKTLGGQMSHKAKLMIVRMSYLVIAADRKVEKSEVETIVEIAGTLGVVRSEALQTIEDIDKSQDEVAAALGQETTKE